jgi:tRNA G18 (ribose-2'-O)-methylase SpoU
MRKLTHDEVAQRRHDLTTVAAATRLPVSVVLDNVRSLYNVGSIFRTSDGALIEKLHLCGFTPHPPRREIEKTALGATQSVPWEYHPNAHDAVLKLKRSGKRICVLELTTESVPYNEVKKEHFPLCLVIGNELTGISRDIIDLADLAIEIPMFGIKHSLNVAVAYGIALFELVKTYRRDSMNLQHLPIGQPRKT